MRSLKCHVELLEDGWNEECRETRDSERKLDMTGPVAQKGTAPQDKGRDGEGNKHPGAVRRST